MVSRELNRALDGQHVQSLSSEKLQDFQLTNISIVNTLVKRRLTKSFHLNVGDQMDPDMKDVLQDFIGEESLVSVMVYTDGSVYGGEVGCGACSAVLYPPSASGKISYQTRAVGRMVNIEECEIEGIILGIDTAIDHLKNRLPTGHNATAYILCDSIAAIETFDKSDACLSARFKKTKGIMPRANQLRHQHQNSKDTRTLGLRRKYRSRQVYQRYCLQDI